MGAFLAILKKLAKETVKKDYKIKQKAITLAHQGV